MSDRNMRKTNVGRVVSDKMDKTIVVAIEDSVKHPLYKKDYQAYRETEGARRKQRVPRRRSRSRDGDPPPVERQEMESR